MTTTVTGVGVDDRAWRSFLDAHGELAWSDDPYTALGGFRDDPNIILQALEYLGRWRSDGNPD